ncbi:hypothetical protein HUJ04_012795 [Dendroctonus ponderosae]|nr:hypothetical protein HUJ04_012795 [Dendroctonus ponderosae]KAH1030067.1 hypothetical protein HUJ05_003199 [Dendroctonus ponderosae]
MASQEEDNKLECISNVNKDQERYYLNVYKLITSRMFIVNPVLVLFSHGGHIRCRVTSENIEDIGCENLSKN